MLLLLWAILILSTWLVSAPRAMASDNKRNVLYINSYHHGYQWSDSILQGVRNELDQSKYKVDLQIEYMDAKRFNVKHVIEALLHLYREKFKTEKFDVVIASDDDAFNFALQYRPQLFPDTPIVFCGVNELNREALKIGNVTGVIENFDLDGTIAIALRLHPDKNKMVVVGDASTAGYAIKHQIEDVVPAFRDRLHVDYWIQVDLPEVQRRVKNLPQDTFLFFIPYYQVIGNSFYTAEEVMHEIYIHSSVPIYTAWEFLLGSGAVGGSLLSGFEHGKKAAAMALEILGGKKADTIAIKYGPDSVYGFDYNVMQRLNIKEKLLPEGANIINTPNSSYALPRELFWTIIISCFLLLSTVIFLALNIVAKRKVEQKIKNQLTFQETLIDTIPLLVSWKDTQRHYVGANLTFANFFGLKTINEVVGQNTSRVVTDSEYAQWSTSADSAVVSGQGEFRRVRKEIKSADGQVFWLEVNKVPLLDENGLINGILTTAENITREHNLEKQLLQSQKMKAIGTLAGGIAHDFNNILTSIINSTELALSDVDTGSQTEKDLDRVLKAARRGGRVVKQILAFSRPTKEGFRATDLSGVVIEVIQLIEVGLPANITIHSHISPTMPKIYADPTQLHQAVMNLCTNGFHALREKGGGLYIRLEEASLNDEEAAYLNLESGEYILLSVADNGPGIDPEIIDKIFDPFFSSKDKAEGTGLGLSVVLGIVKGHSGAVRVKSELGHGATFEIFLPRIEISETEHRDERGIAGKSEARILFVEDDLDQLESVPRILGAEGYHVEGIAGSSETYRLIDADPNRFDLLITDYDMPKLNGIDLVKLISHKVPTLPVIMISGREEALIEASNLEAVKKILTKPYDKEELIDAIETILQEMRNHG
ncbi:PAS domain S-box-containing protein [Desulforhopalus singaporensis]|uniref:histidine kinase n=1 Tax=Desulforhopalus singaporensis TaxID=91360 RepID=A0A1H0PQP8_9BACT|nr:PAS domain S-box-containing protein [Desulforhopalus singaporensis]